VHPVVHPVVYPVGLAARRLEVLPEPEEVQAALEVLLGLEALLVPEPLPLVRQAQSLELFLLSALRLLALEWLVWSALQ
jgi:hypothetical protein